MKSIRVFVVLAMTCIALGGQAQMKVNILDVGQGSAAIIEFPCGVIMIDTGGEKNDEFNSVDSLMKQMKKIFDARRSKVIDLLILSHPHKDHTLGVKEILKQGYQIKNVITNGQTTGSGKPGQLAILNAISKSESTATTADDIGYYESVVANIGNNGVTNNTIDPLNCTGTNPKVTVLWGRVDQNTDQWSQKEFENANNHSVVCKIEYGTTSILFAGDVETDAVKSIVSKYQRPVLDADVYVVSHHGARNGTTAQFISAVSPKIAVMSFGDPDRHLMWTAFAYGHPNKQTLDILLGAVTETRTPVTVPVADGAENFALQQIDKAVYGVGWDGALKLTSNGTSWSVDKAVERVNVNTATLADLKKKLPIKSNVAQAIVDYRTTKVIASLADLDNVKGVGPATLNLIAGLVKFTD